MLEQDIIKKGLVDNKALAKPKKNVEFKAKGIKEYKFEAIINSVVYSH